MRAPTVPILAMPLPTRRCPEGRSGKFPPFYEPKSTLNVRRRTPTVLSPIFPSPFPFSFPSFTLEFLPFHQRIRDRERLAPLKCLRPCIFSFLGPKDFARAPSKIIGWGGAIARAADFFVPRTCVSARRTTLSVCTTSSRQRGPIEGQRRRQTSCLTETGRFSHFPCVNGHP